MYYTCNIYFREISLSGPKSYANQKNANKFEDLGRASDSKV